jgi:hypothetical protein
MSDDIFDPKLAQLANEKIIIIYPRGRREDQKSRIKV